MVARITEYLQVSFQSVTGDTIKLLIQVFNTLNELCAVRQTGACECVLYLATYEHTST